MPGTWLLRALAAAALVLSATGCVGIGGETISLSHEKLRTPPSPSSGAIPMPRSAEDVRGQKSRIGRATITVFAITSGSVVTRTPIGDEVSLQVADALRAAGYEVQVLDGSAPAGPESPLLAVEVEEFYFRNYNYFWPIVPTWGDVTLGFRVQRPDGVVAFDRSLSGEGSSFCLLGECAFQNATREAMTELLDKLVEMVASEPFRNAMGIEPARSVGATNP